MKSRLAFLLLGTWLLPSATAHSMYQAAVLLDFTGNAVRVELQLPVERIAIAFSQPIQAQMPEGERLRLMEYVSSHVHASLPDGRPFPARFVSPLALANIDGASYLVARLLFTPPASAKADLFDLKDETLLNRISAQVVLVSIRSDWSTSTFANDPQLVGVLRGDVRSIRIDRTDANWWRGFGSIFHLGLRHIAEGTDHLLFLLALLLPAPLLVRHRRWATFAGIRHALLQILKVVTAFTLGHSITLAAAALGLIHVPSHPIEVLIAVSILISAVHALHPLFPGREAMIAAFFGLIHGLAFATTLGELGLSRWERVASIFSFNLGIETMQLVVVAATMPSLILLSRTRLYPFVRVLGGLFAAVVALGWIGQRLWDLRNPFDELVEALAQHALWIGIALLVLSLIVRMREKVMIRPSSQQQATGVS